MQAFDAANNLLGTVYYAGPLPTQSDEVGPAETLTFTSSGNNIATVRFSSQSPGNPPSVPPTYGLFDNLNFLRVFPLSYNTTGSGSVSANPEQPTYVEGTVVTLTATPAPGWKFSNWSGDASGTANPLQLTMDGNKTVTAIFVLALPTPEAMFCANFNSGVPQGMTLFGQAAVSNGFLKLTTGDFGQYGIAYIHDFNGGALVSAFRVSFKAALFGAADGQYPADGFSFNLVPAASVLANPDYGQPAEEGLADGLAVNFDTFDNGGGEAPAIDVKWLGQIIATVPFQCSQSPSGATDPVAASQDVIINLDADGTIDVSYGGIIVLNNVQTPYRPGVIGVPIWVFGARTGAATDNHWISDLCIETLAGAKFCTDFDSGVPPGMSLFGDGRVDAGLLKLYTIPETNSFGVAYLDDFGGGQFVQAFRATFKAALFGSTYGPADGFSFNLVPAARVLPKPDYAEPGEEGLDEGLAVIFDTWDNGNGEAPAFEIKWLGKLILSTPFQASQSPAGITNPAEASRDVVIELKADGRIDVSYGEKVLCQNVPIPYDPAAIRTPKWVVGARVGTANDNYWFDDLCVATVPAHGSPIPGLYNTGVDDMGLPLADNTVDPHYQLAGGTEVYVATGTGGFPIPPWVVDNRTSAWISPATDTLAPGDGLGTYDYTYETTFDLTGFDPASARLEGRWATDNMGVDILLNGLPTAQVNTAQFTDWSLFLITGGFVSGTNRLSFVVNNGVPGQPDQLDPTGLRVEVWGAASLDCPLPGWQPLLNHYFLNGSLLLSWHVPGFVLQSASSVSGPYHDLTRGTSVNGKDFSHKVPASSVMSYFRLRGDCD